MHGRYLLDTNIVIALFKQDAAVQARLSAAAEILLPSTVLGELYFGAAKSDQPQQNEARIDEFARGSCTVLGTDSETARLYGSIKADLKRQGRPVPENDVWIAASARQYGLTLVTRDLHFERIQGLLIEAW